MLSDKESVRGIESFYDNLVGLEISVPCSTWAYEEAVKCWGKDYGRQTAPAQGIIKKVSLHRKTKSLVLKLNSQIKQVKNCLLDLILIM